MWPLGLGTQEVDRGRLWAGDGVNRTGLWRHGNQTNLIKAQDRCYLSDGRIRRDLTQCAQTRVKDYASLVNRT